LLFSGLLLKLLLFSGLLLRLLLFSGQKKSQVKKPRSFEKKPISQDTIEKAKILGKKPRSGNTAQWQCCINFV
jgi:hypothetical protein